MNHIHLPGEALRTITPQTPIHILQLQPACSTTSWHFHLAPYYESLGATTNISLNTAKLNTVNISALEFRIWQHLEDHWNGTLLHHPGQYTFRTHWQALQADDYQWQTCEPISFYWWVNRRNSFSLHTIFSCRSLHNGYSIAHISGIRDTLLLLLLVLTCQISALTFTIRFYMIYYCGW